MAAKNKDIKPLQVNAVLGSVRKHQSNNRNVSSDIISETPESKKTETSSSPAVSESVQNISVSVPDYRTTENDLISDIVREKNKIKSTDTETCIRQTFYITYEELEAISLIAFEEDIQKSLLLREILDKGLEERRPGVFEEVQEKANRNRQRKNKHKR